MTREREAKSVGETLVANPLRRAGRIAIEINEIIFQIKNIKFIKQFEFLRATLKAQVIKQKGLSSHVSIASANGEVGTLPFPPPRIGRKPEAFE